MLSFRECMEEMLEVIGRKRLLVPVPWWLADAAGLDPRHAAQPAADRDQVTLLKSDNVVSAEAENGRPHLRRPRHPAAVDRRRSCRSYLWRYRPAGQFTRKTEA